MTKSTKGKAAETLQEWRDFQAHWVSFLPLFRWVGYGLLLLSLVDGVLLLIPPRFLNPVWEFQTMSTWVDRAPVLLLAMLLVFWGGLEYRGKVELIVLRSLSWLCLGLGVIFFLMVPLGIVDTLRLNHQAMTLVDTQYSQQFNEADRLEAQLDEASPDEIIAELEAQGVTVQADNPDELKNRLLAQLATTRQELETQYQAEQQHRQVGMVKDAVRLTLGAAVAGALLLRLGRSLSRAQDL